MMHIDELLRPSIEPDDAHLHVHSISRRCRFIAHTADLSAFAGCSGIPLNLLNLISRFERKKLVKRLLSLLDRSTEMVA